MIGLLILTFVAFDCMLLETVEYSLLNISDASLRCIVEYFSMHYKTKINKTYIINGKISAFAVQKLSRHQNCKLGNKEVMSLVFK